MICRNYKEGQKLDVAGLYEVTVIIDRSETELTEIGINLWRENFKGPPHKHEKKEQVFYVIKGNRSIKVGSNTYAVEPGNIVYIIHQTITETKEPLTSFLYNAFENSNKEGHASFADHINKVKETRKAQAEKANNEGYPLASEENTHLEKLIFSLDQNKKYDFGSNLTYLLLDRSESERVELTLVIWPEYQEGAHVTHKEIEQTFFILVGEGNVQVGEESQKVKPGDVVFIPRNTAHTTKTFSKELPYLCFNTIVSNNADKCYDEMYHRVAPARIERWKSGYKEVGE